MRRNAKNERIKIAYFDFLQHADGKADATIRQVRRALEQFEDFTGRKGFKTFDQRQVKGFKDSLCGSPLAVNTIHSRLKVVQKFLRWLAYEPGYKRSISLRDIEYLNLTDKTIRAAQAPKDKPFPSLEQIEQVIMNMPSTTAIERRDRALVAFVAITGIRAAAVTSLQIRHYDVMKKLIIQQPDEVNTKASKKIYTFLLPLDERLEAIFLDWVDYLKKVEKFAPHDPLFPQTKMGQNEKQLFTPVGVKRKHWKSTASMRKIFKRAFKNAGFDPYTPHRFRNMIVAQMHLKAKTDKEKKAWSQNLGHKSIATTYNDYGHLSVEEQGEAIRSPQELVKQGNDELMDAMREMIRQEMGIKKDE
jgi:integrase